MRQKTPTKWGRARWRGGPGRPGQLGGWGYECTWCLAGALLTAMRTFEAADVALYTHVEEKHASRPEVQAVLKRTE